jgi:hypothetical protein
MGRRAEEFRASSTTSSLSTRRELRQLHRLGCTKRSLGTLRQLWCMLQSLGSLSKLSKPEKMLWEHSLLVLHRGSWHSSVGPQTLEVPEHTEHTEHTQLEQSRWLELPEHTEELPERIQASHTERTEEHTEAHIEPHTEVHIEAPWNMLGWASRLFQVAAEQPAWPLQLGQALPLAQTPLLAGLLSS